MQCPYCGSLNLVHDFSHGYVICPLCGTVVDTIFIEFYEEQTSDNYIELNQGLPSIRKGLEKKKMHIMKTILTRISANVTIYERYAKRAKKNVYVDFEAVLKREKHRMSTVSRIYRHKDEDRILRLVAEDPMIRSIMDNIINKDPILSSRTPRGKVALALIIKNLVEGTSVDLHDLCKKTSMSPIHMKRLINLAMKRLPYIRLNFLKSIVSNNSANLLQRTPP